MGCGCSGISGLGALGLGVVPGDTTPTIFYDFNPAGPVRCLRDEARVEMKKMLDTIQALVAVDPKNPDQGVVTNAQVAATAYPGAQLTPWAQWVASKIKEGKKVAASGVSGDKALEFPPKLSDITTLILFAGPDEHLVAGPSTLYAPAILEGYTPWSEGAYNEWKAKQGGAQKQSVWSGPVPWLIGGAVLLGIGAVALSQKKRR